MIQEAIKQLKEELDKYKDPYERYERAFQLNRNSFISPLNYIPRIKYQDLYQYHMTGLYRGLDLYDISYSLPDNKLTTTKFSLDLLKFLQYHPEWIEKYVKIPASLQLSIVSSGLPGRVQERAGFPHWDIEFRYDK
jgi:hypothetical protein